VQPLVGVREVPEALGLDSNLFMYTLARGVSSQSRLSRQASQDVIGGMAE